MEKSLYVKRNYEESVCQEEKSLFLRRIGQFAYLSGRKDLVTQKKEIYLSKRRDCSKEIE